MIEWLASDLRREFPDMQGLSPRNLGYKKAFAEAWPDEANFASAAYKIDLVRIQPLLTKDRYTKPSF